MSRIVARLALNRVSRSNFSPQSTCFSTWTQSRAFTTSSVDSISQSTNDIDTEIEKPKKRITRTRKPRIQPFNPSLVQSQAEASSDITSSSSQLEQPKKTRGRPRKQPVVLADQDQSVTATTFGTITPVKKSVMPRRRAIRKPASFEHTAPAPFGMQDVLSLLYTYLPGPHTAGQSSLPHPVQIYDVHSRSIFNNFVIVVFCTSARQMSYLAQAVYKLARARDACPLNKSVLSLERHKATDWQMVDMGPIMLHVFNVNATITQPSLDYHASLPEPVVHHRSRRFDDEYEGREPRIPEPEREAVVLQRHPVVDSLERQFGDCLVPVERHLSLKDYTGRLTDEEGEQQIVEVQ